MGKSRVRGHNYITGFGDGDAKVTHQDNGLEKALLRRSNNNINKDPSKLRKSAGDLPISDPAFDRRKNIPVEPPKARDNNEPGITKENWDLYFPDHKPKKVRDAGSEFLAELNSDRGNHIRSSGQTLYKTTRNYPYRNPTPQAADPWQFSAFFVFAAAIILVSAVFLHVMADNVTERSKSGGGNKKKKHRTNLAPVSVNFEDGKARKIKTDEYNEDYDEEHYLLSESVRGTKSADTEETRPPHAIYYPYQPRKLQEHRHRKNTGTSGSVSATNAAATGPAAATAVGASTTPTSSSNKAISSPTVNGGGAVCNAGGIQNNAPNGLQNRLYYLNQAGSAVVAGQYVSSKVKKTASDEQHTGLTPPFMPANNANNSFSGLQLPDALLTPNAAAAGAGTNTPSRQKQSNFQGSETLLGIGHQESSESYQYPNLPRMYARPLSTTASSFESLTEHPGLLGLNDLSEQSSSEHLFGFPNYDEEAASSHPEDDTNLQASIRSKHSPNRRSEFCAKTPTNSSRLLMSPGSDDAHLSSFNSNTSGHKLRHTNSFNEQGTPVKGPRSRLGIPEIMETTPRIANGRQIIETVGSSSSGQNVPLAVPENTPLRMHEIQQPLLNQQAQPQQGHVRRRSFQNKPQPFNPPKPQYDFGNGEFSMQFASPPRLQGQPLRDDQEKQAFMQSRTESPQQQKDDIPFVPNLYVPVAEARPPKSINVDDLHLYQLMESGNVSHWEAQVAEESRLLHNQLFPGAPSRSDKDNRLDRASIHDAGNIRDFVLAASTDITSNDSIPSDDPRKSIVHKREDLTAATDSGASLQGAVDFSELKLVEVIGGGGFGQVWKAVWRGTPVAVKVLTGSAQSSAVPRAVLEEFAAEINLLKGMRHPNICLYMGACLMPPNRAIITELAANGSLWDALRLPLCPPYTCCDGLSRDGWPSSLYKPDSRHGAPPVLGTPVRPSSMSSTAVPSKGTWHWILVKRVACGAARGMAYLHSGKPPILHRDLKSANILLDESYTAKVCDFGLSRLKAQERSMTGNCGTVQWMAPEVLANETYNEKADVFSYGIICWELLTAECPYDGMTPIQCALAVLNRNQRPDIPKWCPPPLQALIRACVKKDPQLRPTFEQIIEALDSMP